MLAAKKAAAVGEKAAAKAAAAGEEKAAAAREVVVAGAETCRLRLAKSVSPKVISVLMGHKAPKRQPDAAPITLRRYTHVLPGELERARDQLQGFLRQLGSSHSVGWKVNRVAQLIGRDLPFNLPFAAF